MGSAQVIAETQSARMAKADLRKHHDETRQSRRAVLGGVLATALVLLRKTRLKEQADFLQRDPRQVARWFNGSEAVPWEEILAIRELQFPLMQALLESCQADLVEVRTVITARQAVTVFRDVEEG